MKVNHFYFAFAMFTICNIAIAQNTTILRTNTTQGQGSVYLGVNSGLFASGIDNITIGHNAGNSFDETAMTGGITGNYNVFVGTQSGLRTLTGSSNLFLGAESGKENISGLGNIALGRCAGQFNQSGQFNVYIGHFSGQRNTGSGNVFIGAESGFNLTNVSNQLYITNTNTFPPLIWGDFSSRNLRFNVNSSATSFVEITGAFNNSGLRFTNLTSNFNPAPTATATKFLTVNATGDVILQNLPSSTTGVAAITAGTNVLVAGNGSSAAPYNISSKNIYTHDDSLTSHRTMLMGDFNLNFISPSATGGKVYIGATPSFPTTTGNYRLYVEGGILTEKAKVALRNASHWADYVFANEYKLMPLNEVETFVKENKHLPGIESAEDLVKSGLDLGDMQAKQMGKIEELTLYLIAQNKTLEKQNQEIEELKAQVKALLAKK